MALRTLLLVATVSLTALAGSASAQIFMPRPEPPAAMPPGQVPEDDDDVVPPDTAIQTQPLPPVAGGNPGAPMYTLSPPGLGPDPREPTVATAPPIELTAPGTGQRAAPGIGPAVAAPAVVPAAVAPQPAIARAVPPSDAPRPPMGVDERPTASLPGSSLPPEYQPETEKKELPANLRRQTVEFKTKEPAGTIIIDTPNTYLYFVLGNGMAMRYGIGVGREGFTWTGREKITRKAEWPDWFPPSEMIERQPYLPRFMAGGESNPLGARAMYLGKTLYRIHGTNQPSTIGTFVSSGCIRLVNGDIEDLFERVKVGTKVVVLPGTPPTTAAAKPPVPQAAASNTPATR
ncbi:MAG: L,D-transpeptidase family protein [Xanthobacteraceae bacterium]